MESSATWDQLTAALAVAGVSPIERTWGFLVYLGLVGNRPDVRRALEAAIVEVLQQGEITGPSQALRIANRFRYSGVHLHLAVKPDPDAKKAAAAFEGYLAHGAPIPPPIEKPFDRVFCRHCGVQTRLDRGCEKCAKDPLDPVALAVELGMGGATVQLCKQCARVNRSDPYCYYCGLAQ